MPIGTIYHAFDTTNGLAYVGQTWERLERRANGHRTSGRKSQGFHFQHALNKRPDSFVWSVLTRVTTQEEMDRAEDDFIIELNTLWPNGYNLKRGGRGGRMSDVSKERNRQSHLGRPSKLKGRTLSEETKSLMSRSHKGKRFPEETRQKMSLAMRESWKRRAPKS